MENTAVPLTIVLPFIDAEADVRTLVEEAHTEIASRVPGTEILAIEGNGRDKSWAILQELCQTIPSLRAVRTRQRSNLSACTLQGIQEAAGQLVLQREPHCPWQIAAFWEMARLRKTHAGGLVLANRPANLRPLRERFLLPFLREENGFPWPESLEDPMPPLLLFAKSELERLQVLLPQDAAAPVLLIALLFSTLDLPTTYITPHTRFLLPRKHIRVPSAFSGLETMRATFRQAREATRNAGMIRGLLETN